MPDHDSSNAGIARPGLLVATLCAALAPFGDVSAESCFAEVTVPPPWQVERTEVERREASTRFEITPARFVSRERRVRVHDAASVVTAVQPELRNETQRRETAPATTRWVRDGLDGERPMSAGDRIDLVAAGIDIDAVPPGTCLVEAYRPPRVTYTEERVLVREASERLVVSAAVFDTIRRPVTVRPAHTRLIEVPTVWDEDRRHVERAAMLTRVREPAISESVEMTRLLTDAVASREPMTAVRDTIEIPHVEAPGAYSWQSGTRGGEPVLAAAVPDAGATPTGRRLCHRAVPIAAIEYERLVVREEGRFERHRIEPGFVVLEAQALLEDARGERVERPAVVESVERRKPIGAARVERRQILCEADLTHSTVTRLQRALEEAGFSPGGIDGRLGPATRGAVDRFQASRDLAAGALTIETVEALGVSRR